MKRIPRFLLFIFIFAFTIRFLSVWPANTIIGFDQARDLFDARKIVLDRDLRIVGPTAGNNANLHHGVAFLYFLIPPLFLGGGNPVWAVLWNSLINTGSVIILYLFAKSLFKSKRAGILAAIIASVSYYFVQFSGWLSNPTVTLFTVPVVFFGFWKYTQTQKLSDLRSGKWLVLTAFFLGLSIQFEIFFLYLIPTGLIFWLIFKPKLPNLKIFIYSLLAITFSLSSMLLTEIKFYFSGVRALFAASGAEKPFFVHNLQDFIGRFFQTFSLNLWPGQKWIGVVFGLITIGFLIFSLLSKKEKRETKRAIAFLLLYLASPILMLALGSHAAPWFLIGLSPAIILPVSFMLSKIRSIPLLLSFIIPIVVFNLSAIKNSYGKGQPLLEPDRASILSKQIAAMDYTYRKSSGEDFAIDTVTNPLYINAVWAYNYNWYSKRYGSKPGWLGGDQIPPYDTLPKSIQDEKYFFLIVDTTPRIPQIYTQNAIEALKEKADYIEEVEFDGIKIIMWQNKKLNHKNTTTIKAP